MNKRILGRIFLLSLLVAAGGSFLSAGCGGSETTATATTEETPSLTVKGTVTTASSASASLSAEKGLDEEGWDGAEISADVSLSSQECKLYLNGKDVGTATTGSDGSYSMNVALSDLNPDNKDSIKRKVVLQCGNVRRVVEVTVKGSDEISINADPNSTVGSESLEKLIGADLSGVNFDTLSVAYDVDCLAKIQEVQWGNCSRGESGVKGSCGLLRDLLRASLANGSVGSYANHFKLAQAFFDGSIDNSTKQSIIEAASQSTGTSTATYEAALDEAVDAVVAAASTSASAASSASANCSSEDVRKQFVEVVLGSSSASDLTTNFTSAECVDLMVDLAQKNVDDLLTGENVGRAAVGVIAAFGGSCSNVNADTLADHVKGLPLTNEGLDFRSLGLSVEHTCRGGASCDSLNNVVGFWTAQLKAGSNPCSSSTECLSSFQSRSASFDYAACATDPDSTTCKAVYADGNFQKSCKSNSDCGSGGSCNLTYGLCNLAKVPLSFTFVTGSIAQGCPAQVFATPSALNATFDKKSEDTSSVMLSVTQQGTARQVPGTLSGTTLTFSVPQSSSSDTVNNCTFGVSNKIIATCDKGACTCSSYVLTRTAISGTCNTNSTLGSTGTCAETASSCTITAK